MDRILIELIKDGFRFQCQECGRCCQGCGEGFVFLYDDEIKKITEFLKISYDEFLEKYTEIIESEYILYDVVSLKPTKKKTFLKSIVLKWNEETGACVFLDDKKCKIYEVRPLQCKTWPVWYYLMTKKDQFKEAREKCPGLSILDSDKSTRYYTKEEIIETLKQEVLMEQQYINLMKKFNENLRQIYPYLKNVKTNLDEITK
ncbi:MAG: hypothetical protein GF364_02490 [Candidatus Lokiarchaeota archaeon]|nr:hypothetical protein [Candidatus Lokiarchaeota archaeon]